MAGGGVAKTEGFLNKGEALLDQGGAPDTGPPPIEAVAHNMNSGAQNAFAEAGGLDNEYSEKDMNTSKRMEKADEELAKIYAPRFLHKVISPSSNFFVYFFTTQWGDFLFVM